MTKADGLDALIGTFTRDRQFCDVLAATHAADVGRLLVYANWVHHYVNPIQQELHVMSRRRFPAQYWEEAANWTVMIAGGVVKDLLLIPYLVVRGAISEGGFALRRSLENVGVLSHLWNEPSKSAYLASPESQAFRRAFVWEPDDKRRAQLKAKGIQKRFESCAMAGPLSTLYGLFSAYTVHGGSPAQLVQTELVPTALSCALLNRPDPSTKDLASELDLLGNGCEMLCLELVTVYGTYAKRYGMPPSKAGEGGFYFTTLLERNADGEMARAIDAILTELGWIDARPRQSTP